MEMLLNYNELNKNRVYDTLIYATVFILTQLDKETEYVYADIFLIRRIKWQREL